MNHKYCMDTGNRIIVTWCYLLHCNECVPFLSLVVFACAIVSTTSLRALLPNNCSLCSCVVPCFVGACAAQCCLLQCVRHYNLSIWGTAMQVCKYIDMPLQHMSNLTLLAMNRPPRQHTEQLLTKLRSRIPGLVLRTTFISGREHVTQCCQIGYYLRCKCCML